ncbi:MAG: hypothetical protein ABW001_01585 [Mycobacterium sp.]
MIVSADSRVAAIADRFLPGTSENMGWYREIEAFSFPPSDVRPLADPVRAINELASDWNEHGIRPTIPESSRLIYGLGAVISLTKSAPRGVELGFDDPTAETFHDPLALVLALTGPGEPERTLSSIRPQITDVIDAFADFNGLEDWEELTARLVEFGVLTAQAASIPLCQAVVVKVHGIDSVVIDAKITSDDVTLNQVKAVVDPRNWHNDYPDFFCSMQYRGLRTDGWRRVLERVGICGFSPLILTTMLKFYKTAVNGPDSYEARVDYDLNDPVPDPAGDGQITVDRGYVNMWSTNAAGPDANGVTVRIRKVAHINGLSSYAMAKYVCNFGYAYVAAEMLFGPAANPDPNLEWTPWDDDPNEIPTQAPGAGQYGAKPGQSPNTVASTAITMMADCVKEMTAKQSDLVDKWAAGDLTVADLAQYSAEVGARLASDPWKFIQAIGKTKGGGS